MFVRSLQFPCGNKICRVSAKTSTKAVPKSSYITGRPSGASGRVIETRKCEQSFTQFSKEGRKPQKVDTESAICDRRDH